MYVGILILVPVYRVLSSDSVPTVDWGDSRGVRRSICLGPFL